MDEMTGLPPNLDSIFFFFFCTSCNIPTAHTTSILLPASPHPLHAQALSGNCHRRRSSCVTRLAVMRLSVSASVSRCKSPATLDELQTSHPPRTGGEGVMQKRVERRREGGKEGVEGREGDHKDSEIGSNHGDAAPLFSVRSLFPSSLQLF